LYNFLDTNLNIAIHGLMWFFSAEQTQYINLSFIQKYTYLYIVSDVQNYTHWYIVSDIYMFVQPIYVLYLWKNMFVNFRFVIESQQNSLLEEPVDLLKGTFKTDVHF
jgi:predicted P-loop ATPase/GTPase